MTAPNFARLDGDRPEISRLMTAMLQAREALSRRSWSHPLEYTAWNGGPTCSRTLLPADKHEAATAVAL